MTNQLAYNIWLEKDIWEVAANLRTNRELIKQGSRQLLAAIKQIIAPMHDWWEKEQTRAEVEVEILDQLFEVIPIPPYSEEDAQKYAAQIYNYIWQRCTSGNFPVAVAS